MKLKPEHPALHENRTIHPKMVKDPKEAKSIFKPVSSNSKLGKGSAYILKGKWRGMPMYSLTLQERATCPDTCIHWSDCYGNNMGFAHRFQHGPELEARIEKDIAELARKHPRGFVVRLHVLGDFYSIAYALLWRVLLSEHPALHIFGYTARKWTVFQTMNGERCWIRESCNTGHAMTAGNVYNPEAIQCPEQTGKTESCLTCGICWSTRKPVTFQTH